MQKRPSKKRERGSGRSRAQIAMVGVGWYEESEWAKVKESALDPDGFEDTFEEWVALAKSTIAKLRAAGVMPVKVPVSAAELLEWCRLHNKRNISTDRAEFVVRLLRSGVASI